MSEFVSTTIPKFTSVFTAIAFFFIVLGVLFAIAGRANGKKARPIALVIFLAPALVLLVAGLIIPAIRTFLFSFMNPDSNEWIGFENYYWMTQDPNIRTIMVNTILWILVVPIFTAALGLLLAIMLDRIKHESIPKSLLFMPMAISFVGASIIFKFVYEYNEPDDVQIGLLSAIVKFLGATPSDWMLSKPLNTFLLMIIYVWTQMGFGMVILSAAIKAVPADIVEASALDGAHGWRLFRNITFPMIKGTFIVVLATGVVGALKVFDIVRTMTGGNFSTNVLANEMYSQVFVQFDTGKGSALAIVLFLLVTPILVYNIRSLRMERAHA
ncbi:alpha-glucoside transport system permease protein [Candidatus Planktophila vernalis]|jgi:alpha-glucoside transport system permease protein|uniref:Alpha-glucoside transport system permease protein n=1 Tax=Candidatus Planktophila vernalis TaxID=1884907 RepID=A0A249KV03_9ACTN|nr:sugar ABC transporter permease [Candidatus Planktophila vernalis]ASY20529.1 alpha-glucoside transport system permease protein [Candidatus Planktophila vernalis]